MLVKDNKRKKRQGGKMDCRWLGPYTIVKSLGKGLYGLEATDNTGKTLNRVHGFHLKPYLSPLPKSAVSCTICTPIACLLVISKRHYHCVL